jgi:glutathione S-transferase
MTLKLYGFSGSPYTWRVQLALEHKQVAYELETLSVSGGDARSAAFRALNPRGRVPVLVDLDYVLYESLAILAYIETRWPTPRLFGHAPRDTGTIWRVIAEYTSYLDEAVESFILPLYNGKVPSDVERVTHTLTEELGSLTDQLQRTKYLAGDELTAADLVVLPHVQSILRAASKPAAKALVLPFLPLAPPLDAWRLASRPCPITLARCQRTGAESAENDDDEPGVTPSSSTSLPTALRLVAAEHELADVVAAEVTAIVHAGLRDRERHIEVTGRRAAAARPVEVAVHPRREAGRRRGRRPMDRSIERAGRFAASGERRVEIERGAVVVVLAGVLAFDDHVAAERARARKVERDLLRVSEVRALRCFHCFRLRRAQRGACGRPDLNRLLLGRSVRTSNEGERENGE